VEYVEGDSSAPRLQMFRIFVRVSDDPFKRWMIKRNSAQIVNFTYPRSFLALDD